MDKLGLVFSSRVRSAALCVLALWILAVLGTSFFQILGAYLGGGGFDATARHVILTNMLLLPYYVAAAVILRSLAARLALFHKLRQHIVVAEYSPPEVLSPLEAGLLAANNFRFQHLAAMLKDLEVRGCIAIIE